MTTIRINKTCVCGGTTQSTEEVDYDTYVDQMPDEDFALAGGYGITPKSLCAFLSGRFGSEDCYTEVRAEVL